MCHKVIIEYYQKVQTQTQESWTELLAVKCEQVKSTCVGNPTNDIFIANLSGCFN